MQVNTLCNVIGMYMHIAHMFRFRFTSKKKRKQPKVKK